MLNLLQDDEEDGQVTVQDSAISDDAPTGESSTSGTRYRTIEMDELVSPSTHLSERTWLTLHPQIEKLPPMISFSEMDLPFETTGCKLYRRDLYDARFQVIDELPSDDEDEEPLTSTVAQEDKDTATYVNADTDLIPGTYEGGLKTWEGGMDLVEILEEQHRRIPGGVGSWAQGKRILEVGSTLFLHRITALIHSQVGCGTGLPCIYLLHRLLQLETPSDVVTEIHLQDYNISVLQLVTLPNLILATIPESSLEPLENNLELTEEIVQGFKNRLRDANIKLSFSYGDWSGFAQTLQGVAEEAEKAGYDLVLTAETIYRLDSVPSLIQVLKRSPKPEQKEIRGEARGGDVTSALDNLTLQKPWEANDVVILVAAKVGSLLLHQDAG